MPARHAHLLDRRTLLLSLATATAATLAGCGRSPADGQSGPPASAPGPAGAAQRSASPPEPLVVPPPHPGPAVLVTKVPAPTQDVVLTIDDGYAPEVVAAYAQFARDSGVHLTFNPNGVYAREWEPQAAVLRPLVDAGQVQIGNHTFSHRDVRRLSDAEVAAELERNEQWVQKTFSTTTRPWWRPPYGFHNATTDAAAAAAGWTRVLMWNGSLGDAALLTPEVLLQQAELYLKPGVVMLGHANHPTVTGLYQQIVELITSRQLTPKTLDEAFGTSRATG